MELYVSKNEAWGLGKKIFFHYFKVLVCPTKWNKEDYKNNNIYLKTL